MFNAISSVVVGPLAIRPRVAPLAVGWLLIVGGLRESAEWADPCGFVHDPALNRQWLDRGRCCCWLWLDSRWQHTPLPGGLHEVPTGFPAAHPRQCAAYSKTGLSVVNFAGGPQRPAFDGERNYSCTTTSSSAPGPQGVYSPTA